MYVKKKKNKKNNTTVFKITYIFVCLRKWTSGFNVV